MSAIDDIMCLLKDGEWHELEQVTKKVALPKFKVELAVNFLEEYDFIQLNENVRRIKLQPTMLKFIEEIQRLEKEASGH